MKKIVVAALLLCAVVACKEDKIVVSPADASGDAAVQLSGDVSAVDAASDVTAAADATPVDVASQATAD